MLDLSDDGFETVRLKDDDGSVIFEKSVDLWETHNRLVDIQKKHQGQPAYLYHAALVAFLQEQGFPEVSHRFAARFALGIAGKVAELKNGPAGEPSPSLPASTSSTSSR